MRPSVILAPTSSEVPMTPSASLPSSALMLVPATRTLVVPAVAVSSSKA
jgi:hypothetical protein